VTAVDKKYANVYDTMYAFFRNGDASMISLMKVSIDSLMISPYTSKLSTIQIMVQSLVFAA